MFFFSDGERQLIREYRDGTVTEREIIVKKYGYTTLSRLVDEKEAEEKKFNDEELQRIALLEVNEKKNVSWIDENSKPCPRCEVPIEVIIQRSFTNYLSIDFSFLKVEKRWM